MIIRETAVCDVKKDRQPEIFELYKEPLLFAFEFN